MVLARTTPGVARYHLPTPPLLDERIAARLTKIPLKVEGVATRESYGRMLIEAAKDERARLIVVADQPPAEVRAAFGAQRIFHGNEEDQASASIAFMEAGASHLAGRDRDRGWTQLLRASANVERVVVAGPQTTPDDCAAIADEVVLFAPELYLDLAPEWPKRPIVVALDDPIRHLGPSRTAASLRDRVLKELESTERLFIAAPLAARRFLRSRVPHNLRQRLVFSPLPARLDPGPRTLIDVGARLCRAVDVVGFDGTIEPLAGDQMAHHAAYADSAPTPADCTDALHSARADGVSVHALGRTTIAGLRAVDRGRAPTTLTLEGAALPEPVLAGRFPGPPVRDTVLDIDLGGRGANVSLYRRDGAGALSLVAEFADGDVSAGQRPWPTDAMDQADAILDALDEAMPELVLSRPRDEAPIADEDADAEVARLRATLAPGEGPEGPFETPAAEVAAVRRYRALVNRDLGRVHVDRQAAFARSLNTHITLIGPGTDPASVNLERLAGEPVMVCDLDPLTVPEVCGAARPFVAMGLTVAGRRAIEAYSQRGGTAPDAILTALPAAHAGSPGDIVFDVADTGAPAGTTDPVSLAAHLLDSLKVGPLFALDPQGPLPEGAAAVTSGAPTEDALAFHTLYARADWKGAPPVVLAVPDGIDFDAMQAVVSGLGGRLLTLVTDGQRWLSIVGDRIAAQDRGTLPALQPDDPALLRTIKKHGPAVLIVDPSAASRLPASVEDVPRVVMRPLTATAPADLDRARMALVVSVANPNDPIEPAPQPQPRPSTEPPPGPAPEKRRRDRLGSDAPPSRAAQTDRLRGAVESWAGRRPSPTPGGFRPATMIDTFKTLISTGADRSIGSTMSEFAVRSRSAFGSLWPWPGLILLVLLCGWLAYMGWLAEAPDLETAFFGLAGVCGLLVLFALRMVTGARAATARPADAPRRSAIPDAGLDAPAALPNDGMPRNARMRSRHAERARQSAVDVEPASAEPGDAAPPPDPAPEPVAQPTPQPIQMDRAPEPAAPPVPVDLAPAPVPAAPPAETSSAIAQLERALNREKAERGAQVARLEQAIAAAAKGEGPDLSEALKNVVSVQAFNAAINERLLPRIETLIAEKIAAQPAGTAPPTDPAFIKDLDALKAAQAKQQAELERLSAAPAPAPAPAPADGSDPGVQSIREGLAALEADIAVLKTSPAAPGETAALAERFEAFEKKTNNRTNRALKGVETLQAELAALGERSAAHSSAAQEQLSRAIADITALKGEVEGLSATIGALTKAQEALRSRALSPPPEAKGEGDEVKALRDALSTIISQNRAIKEQQDVLTARFENPVRVEVETTPDSGR
ncbi:MAG: hypothetical protein AAF318_19460 [Pseudomonadota bacterium]